MGNRRGEKRQRAAALPKPVGTLSCSLLREAPWECGSPLPLFPEPDGLTDDLNHSPLHHFNLRIHSVKVLISDSVTCGKGGMMIGPHLPEPPLWICCSIFA